MRRKLTRRQRMWAQYVAAGLVVVIAVIGGLVFILGSGSTTSPTVGTQRTIRHIEEHEGPTK